MGQLKNPHSRSSTSVVQLYPFGLPRFFDRHAVNSGATGDLLGRDSVSGQKGHIGNPLLEFESGHVMTSPMRPRPGETPLSTQLLRPPELSGSSIVPNCRPHGGYFKYRHGTVFQQMLNGLTVAGVYSLVTAAAKAKGETVF
jgi:hypothetical protein